MDQVVKTSSDKPQIDEVESRMAVEKKKKKGGWITTPFLAGTMLGGGVAASGATSNLIVYLVEKYNVGSIDAVQISNIVSGCVSITPVAGAIVADAFFGCYPVVAASTAITVLALVLFTLTAAVPALQPAPCSPGSASQCQPATSGQFAILYAAICLLSIGAGGNRFNIATMGAYQFDAIKDREVFFNWYFIFLYSSAIIGGTVIVYIQDRLSWTLGFGLSTAAAALAMLSLLLGARYYRRPVAGGSPFTGMVRVVVAAFCKRKVKLGAGGEKSVTFFHGAVNQISDGNNGEASHVGAPSQSFSFLNRAAVIAAGDLDPANGAILRPWHLCTVRQVEDFKAILRILPLWTTSITLSISIGVQISFTVVQALTMDRSIPGLHFSIPASSFVVSSLGAVVVSLFLLDRLLFPLFRRLAGGSNMLTPLQRIGCGHALTILSMVASALVERRRRGIVHEHSAERLAGYIVPMTATWLILPFALSGAGEALHFPGQVTLYYQEFPESMKNTATGMIALIIALGFYLSSAVVDVVRGATTWLPENLNESKLENLYWLLAVMDGVNFIYYLVCAKLYKYQNPIQDEKDAQVLAHT